MKRPNSATVLESRFLFLPREMEVWTTAGTGPWVLTSKTIHNSTTGFILCWLYYLHVLWVPWDTSKDSTDTEFHSNLESSKFQFVFFSNDTLSLDVSSGIYVKVKFLLPKSCEWTMSLLTKQCREMLGHVRVRVPHLWSQDTLGFWDTSNLCLPVGRL